MIIGIDGNEANTEKRVGVGRYAYELLRQLAKLPNSQKFQIYLKDKPLSDLPVETDRWQYRVVGPQKFWTQLGLPLALFSSCPRPNIFFSPTHYAPRFSPCPRVISIMDLSFLYFPQMFYKKDLWQLKNWTAYSIRKADRILTISQSSRDDIIKYYQVLKEKVVVTYPGISKVSSMKDIKEKYGIKGNYILSVGTLQPRKNYVRLVEAFSTLRLSHDLVVVGKRGWLWEEIYKAPEKFGVEDRVKFLDYVPDEDLPALYKEAACFVLVSLYEGFGIPVLEALSLGCPVVVSNVSSLPEVTGEAGVLVNPESVEEIAVGIKKVLNLKPDEREKLIEKGEKQAKQFSWEKCARETLRVLEEVGKQK